MQAINTPDNSYTNFTTTLNGNSYRITLRWVDRTRSWYIDLSTSAGQTIVNGVKLVPNVSLIKTNNHLIEGGNLYLVPTNSSVTSEVIPTRTNLGLNKSFLLAFYLDTELT